MITLEVEGSIYTNFDKISAGQSIEDINGVFSFTAFPKSDSDFILTEGSQCRVLVDDIPVITGNISVITEFYGVSSHEIVIEGSDKTVDLVESTIGQQDFVGDGISLKLIIELVIKKINSDIKVIDKANPEPFKINERISATTGQSAFDLIQSYARKRQVLVNSDGDGNLVLERGSDDSIDFVLFNSKTDRSRNNIKSGSRTINSTDLFNQYNVLSQGNMSSLDSVPISNNRLLSTVKGQSINDNVRTSRIKTLVAEQSSDIQQCNSRAKWQRDIDKTRSVRYTYTVSGHKHEPSGEIWRFNTLVDVHDDTLRVYDKFLIESVLFTYDIKQGSVTTITLIDKDSYTI